MVPLLVRVLVAATASLVVVAHEQLMNVRVRVMAPLVPTVELPFTVRSALTPPEMGPRASISSVWVPDEPPSVKEFVAREPLRMTVYVPSKMMQASSFKVPFELGTPLVHFDASLHSPPTPAAHEVSQTGPPASAEPPNRTTSEPNNAAETRTRRTRVGIVADRLARLPLIRLRDRSR